MILLFFHKSTFFTIMCSSRLIPKAPHGSVPLIRSSDPGIDLWPTDSGIGLRWDAAREHRMICLVRVLQAAFVQLGVLARDPVHAPLSRHRIDRWHCDPMTGRRCPGTRSEKILF